MDGSREKGLAWEGARFRMVGDVRGRDQDTRKWAKGLRSFGALVPSLLILATSLGRPVAQNPASGFPRADFSTLARQAEALRGENRLVPALQRYEQALQLDPDWYEGWWYLGSVLYELDRYEEAIRPLEKALVLRPGEPEVLALLGLCRYEAGDYERATLALEQAIQAGIGRLEGVGYVARYHYALLLNRRGDHDLAASLLSELAAAGHGRKPALREALGLAALRIPVLPHELQGELRPAVLLAGRAAAAVAESRPQVAVARLQTLVRRHPDLPNVHYLYGNLLAQTRPTEALQEYLRELEISPDHLPARVEVTVEFLEREEFDEAVRHGELAVQYHPESFAARHVLGRAYLEAGRVEDAIRQLEEGVRLAPDSPQLHFTLARAYRRAGRLAEAEREQREFQRLQKVAEEAGKLRP
ncbi:MAG: hypothetical protein Kow00109_02700 [Acidobacteriota bacterium]